jgi:hypothetical protein
MLRKPRSWTEIEGSNEFQSLEPEKRLRVLDWWSNKVQEYGTATGALSREYNVTKLNDFRTRKTQEISSLLAPKQEEEPSLGKVISDQFLSGTRAWDQGLTAVSAASGLTSVDEAAQKIAESERANQNVAQTEDMKKFQEAEGFVESAKQIITNPIDVALPLFAQSIGSQLTPMVAGGAAGVAAGAVTGPGSAVTGLIGAGVGSGVGDAVVSFPDFIREKGYDLTDPEQVKAALSDPDVVAEAAKKSAARGLIVGATSAIGGGIAGKATAAGVAAAAGKTLGQRALTIGAASTADVAIQTGLEGLGEAGAQLASTGKLSPKDIAAEMFVQTPGQVAEIAIGTAARIKDVAPQTSAELEKKGIVKAQEAAIAAQNLDDLAEDDQVKEMLDDLEQKAAAQQQPPTPATTTETVAKPPQTFDTPEAESLDALERYRRGEITMDQLAATNARLQVQQRNVARGEGDNPLQQYVDKSKLYSNDVLNLLSQYGGVEAETLADVSNPEGVVAWLQRNNIGPKNRAWRGRELTPFGDQGAGTPLFDQAPQPTAVPPAPAPKPVVEEPPSAPAALKFPDQFTPEALATQPDDEFNENERVVTGAVERLPEGDPRRANAQQALSNIQAERARRTPAEPPAPAPAAVTPDVDPYSPESLAQLTDDELDEEATLAQRRSELVGTFGNMGVGVEAEAAQANDVLSKVTAEINRRKQPAAPAPVTPAPSASGVTTTQKPEPPAVQEPEKPRTLQPVKGKAGDKDVDFFYKEEYRDDEKGILQPESIFLPDTPELDATIKAALSKRGDTNIRVTRLNDGTVSVTSKTADRALSRYSLEPSTLDATGQTGFFAVGFSARDINSGLRPAAPTQLEIKGNPLAIKNQDGYIPTTDAVRIATTLVGKDELQNLAKQRPGGEQGSVAQAGIALERAARKVITKELLQRGVDVPVQKDNIILNEANAELGLASKPAPSASRVTTTQPKPTAPAPQGDLVLTNDPLPEAPKLQQQQPKPRQQGPSPDQPELTLGQGTQGTPRDAGVTEGLKAQGTKVTKPSEAEAQYREQLMAEARAARRVSPVRSVEQVAEDLKGKSWVPATYRSAVRRRAYARQLLDSARDARFAEAGVTPQRVNPESATENEVYEKALARRSVPSLKTIYGRLTKEAGVSTKKSGNLQQDAANQSKAEQLRKQARAVSAEANRVAAASLGIPNPESITFAPDYTGKTSNLPQRNTVREDGVSVVENVFVNDPEITARQIDRGMEITVPEEMRGNVIDGITFNRKTGKVTAAASTMGDGIIVSKPGQLESYAGDVRTKLEESFTIPEEKRGDALVERVRNFEPKKQEEFRRIQREISEATVNLPGEYDGRVKYAAMIIAGEALDKNVSINANTALKQSFRKFFDKIKRREGVFKLSLDAGVNADDESTWLDVTPDPTADTADTRSQGRGMGSQVKRVGKNKSERLIRDMTVAEAEKTMVTINNKLEFGEQLSEVEQELFEPARRMTMLRDTLQSEKVLDKIPAKERPKLTMADLRELGGQGIQIEEDLRTDLPDDALQSADSLVNPDDERTEVSQDAIRRTIELIEQAAQDFLGIDSIQDTRVASARMFVAPSEPNTVFINAENLARDLEGVDPDAALAYLKKLLNHEHRHLALLRGTSRVTLDEIGAALTKKQLREIAETYYTNYTFNSEEQREQAIQNFMESRTLAAVEYITILSERLQSGESVQDIGDIPQTIVAKVIAALKAVLRQLQTRWLLGRQQNAVFSQAIKNLESGIKALEMESRLGEAIDAAAAGDQAALDAIYQSEAGPTAPQDGVTPQMDSDYLAAVERGDMETAQRMVDEAAKGAGYETVPLYHGTNSEFNEFQIRPTWVADSRGIGGRDLAADFGNRVLKLYAKKGSLISKGAAAIVNDPRNLKSADPVTRDDQGNVIPLSQRFNAESTDIFMSEADFGVDDNGEVRPVGPLDRISYSVMINGIRVETTAKDPQVAARNAVFRMFRTRKMVPFEGTKYTSPQALIKAITASGSRVFGAANWGRKFSKPTVRKAVDGTPMLPARQSEQAELPLIFPSMAQTARVRVGQASPDGRPKGGFWDNLKAMVRGRYSETKRKVGGITSSGRATPIEREVIAKQQAKIQSLMFKVETITKILGRELKKARKANKEAVSPELINTALGTTENPYTDDQVKQLNKTKDAKARAKLQEQFRADNVKDARRISNEALAQLPGYNPKYDGVDQFHTGVAKQVLDMRNYVDELSRALMQGDYIPATLKPVIEANMGVYLHRSYTIYDNPLWKQFMLTPQSDEHRRVQANALRLFNRYAVANIARELREEAQKSGAPMSQRDALRMASRQRDRIADDASNLMAEYLSVADDKSYNFFVTGELPGERKLDIIKVRGQIPKEIRELWGEIKNAETNFTKTIGKMAGYIAATDTARELVRVGLENNYMWKKGVSKGERPAGFHPIYKKGEVNPSAVSPLDDVYAPEEVGTFMRSFRDHKTLDGWAKYFSFFTAQTMAMKTIGNPPQSYVRNFLGNILLMINAGYVMPTAPGQMWKSMKKAGKVALSSSGLRLDEAMTQTIQEAMARGLVADNVESSLMKEMIDESVGDAGFKQLYEAKAFETAMQKAARKSTGVIRTSFNALAKVYQGVDDFWKIFAFEMEKFQQRKAHSDWSAEQLADEAARRVRDKIPTYSLSPELTKEIRRIPFLAPFVTWTSEVIRTSANNLSIAAEDIRVGKETGNKQMVQNGYRAIYGAGAAYAFFPVIAAISKSIFGYDDEDEDAYRRGLPEYEQNASLIFIGERDSGKASHLNVSYLDPFQIRLEGPTAFFRALRGGQTMNDASMAALRETLRPVFSEQLFFGAVMDLARNQTAQGRPIYNEQDTAYNKTTSSIGHLWRVMGPGVLVGSGNRIMLAADGTVLPSGRSFDLTNEVTGMFAGQRLSEQDFRATLDDKVKQYMASRADATQLFSRVFSSQGTVDLNDIGPAYDNAERAHRELFDMISQGFEDAQRMGVPRKDAINILLGSGGRGVSKDAVRDILAGRYRRWMPTEIQLKEAARGGIPDGRARFKKLQEHLQSVKQLDRQRKEEERNSAEQ